MAHFLFWEPYNKAKFQGDFRDLVKAIKDDDPQALHPDVLKLLAAQIDKRPPPVNKRTSLRDSIPWANKIEAAMLKDTGKSWGKLTRAMNKVMDQHPDKSIDALKDHWKEYKTAKRAHDTACRDDLDE